MNIVYETGFFIGVKNLFSAPLSFEMVITESWITGKREVSLAKSLVLEDKPLAKLLVYIKNNSVPRIELWGTRTLTLFYEEDCPFNSCYYFDGNNWKYFSFYESIFWFSCLSKDDLYDQIIPSQEE